MKNNTAILDCVNKIIKFKFNHEDFVVDIKEGDIHDSWNSITDKNGVVWDVNFSWEDSKFDPQPHFSVYEIEEIDGELLIKTSNYTRIKINKQLKSDKDIFFKEERFGYIFDVTSPVVCKIYNKKNEPLFTTKSFNRACDEISLRKINGEMTYMVVSDKNNATKLVDIHKVFVK